MHPAHASGPAHAVQPVWPHQQQQQQAAAGLNGYQPYDGMHYDASMDAFQAAQSVTFYFKQC